MGLSFAGLALYLEIEKAHKRQGRPRIHCMSRKKEKDPFFEPDPEHKIPDLTPEEIEKALKKADDDLEKVRKAMRNRVLPPDKGQRYV